MSKQISVIVPVYNVEEYLRQCLDSLVGQTFRDIEILVVNDGSPDNSQTIIDEYSLKYPDIVRSFIKENGGLSDARNYGIDRAVGEYVAFVDSDDYVAPDMFERMINLARKNDSDVVACKMMCVLSDGRYEVLPPELTYCSGHSIADAPEQLLEVKSYACNKIIRRKLFVDTGLRFPKQHFEDSAIVYNLLYFANRVDIVPFPLYYYRRERPGAITTAVNDHIFDIFKSCDSIRDMYCKLPDYKEKYERVISELVIKHIAVRFSTLMGARNKKVARRYLKHSFDYLNKNVPGWKTLLMRNIGGRAKVADRVLGVIKRSKPLMKLMAAAQKRGIKRRSTVKENKKRAIALKAVGFDLIKKSEEVAAEVGVKLFADFGTLLGFIREDGFMDHDTDLDMGIILGDVSYEEFHEALLRNGFKLWRRYVFDRTVAEESYYFDLNGHRIKCDFNYYEMTGEHARTWLFYRKPGVSYGSNSRDVVEMNYSPITEIETRMVAGRKIPVPADPEKLLAEKYGEGWTRKDTGWIYWQSPAAKSIDAVGYFETEKTR